MDKQPCVYLLASDRNGTLYIGVTSDLVKRVWQHRERVVEGFTHRYDVGRLVWYELHGTMESAITREKQIKKWQREWKLRLIEERNPYWNHLWPEIWVDCIRRSRAGGNPVTSLSLALTTQDTGFPPARE